MLVYIVGISGVGKSSFGAMLADYIDYQFCDLDDFIVAREAKTITALFEQGEATFRAAEKSALRAISRLDNVVVATGGGIIEDAENIELMRQTGKVIFVERPLAQIMTTLEVANRPLLEGDAERLIALYDKRLPLYQAAADRRFDITQRRPALREIASYLNQVAS